MAEITSPRQILRAILQRQTPARPLFVPIAFALASRIENLPLRSFLANPTKISNALQQVRGPLRADAVSCYFDPLLEVEALGAEIEWSLDPRDYPTANWPSGAFVGQLPAGLTQPEDLLGKGRIPIALEVIRRLRAQFREESLLMVGVSGPFTLATRLMSVYGARTIIRADIPDPALELAAAAVAQITKAFAEAGAHLIFVRENSAPTVDTRSLGEWVSLLTPMLNVIRFYEALPILRFTEGNDSLEALSALARTSSGAIVCASLPTIERASTEQLANLPGHVIGLSLEQSHLEDNNLAGTLEKCIRSAHPAVVTTAGDLAPETDITRVAAVGQMVRVAGGT
jgi:uroporphyrinogen-III decarboxylase